MSREFRINSFKLFSLFFALFPLLGIYASGIQGVSLGDFCLLITAILIMTQKGILFTIPQDRKSTRLNSSHRT